MIDGNQGPLWYLRSLCSAGTRRACPAAVGGQGLEKRIMGDQRLITREELFPFVHYEYGEAFYGSWRDMRYRIARDPLQNVHFTPPDKRGEASLEVIVWKGPLGFAAADDSLKTKKLFPFSEEGLQMAAEWLDERARQGVQEWIK